jgi:hypothetical protein
MVALINEDRQEFNYIDKIIAVDTFTSPYILCDPVHNAEHDPDGSVLMNQIIRWLHEFLWFFIRLMIIRHLQGRK